MRPYQQDSPTPDSVMQAERSLIGTMMRYPQASADIAARLSSEMMSAPVHRAAFDAMRDAAASGAAVDTVIVARALEGEGVADAMGWISAFESAAIEPEDAGARIDIVRDHSARRRLRDMAQTALRLTADGSIGAEQILSGIETQLREIDESASASEKTSVSFKDILPSYYERMKEIIQRGDEITGIPTGIRDFDALTLGLQKQELVVVAGRPSMGKTALAMNMIEHACSMGLRAMVFSMEMPAIALLQRAISSIGLIDNQHLRKGTLARPEARRLREADRKLREFDIEIDDKPGLSIQQVRSRAFRAHRQRPLDLVMLDYMQLMQGTAGMSRNEQISEISRCLKQLARDLDAPVIALSQLNRSLESRTDKRPIASDLRESGAVEQDADVIVFVYRDEVYHPDTDDKGIAEIIINKQRMGPTGVVKTRFLGQFSRFENMTR